MEGDGRGLVLEFWGLGFGFERVFFGRLRRGFVVVRSVVGTYIFDFGVGCGGFEFEEDDV